MFLVRGPDQEMADERTSRLRLPALGMDLTELPLAAKAFIATAILVLIGGIAAPSTISTAAILSTLPYFAILAVASIGQHLAPGRNRLWDAEPQERERRFVDDDLGDLE